MAVSDEQLWSLSESLLRNGKLEEAEMGYRQLTDKAGFAPAAHLRISLLAQKKGSFRGATEAARAAFMACDRTDAEILEMVAKRLIRLGEFEAVDECVRAILDLPEAGPGALAELGKLLVDIFMPRLAVDLLARASIRGLKTPAVDYLHGLALTQLGEIEAAEQLIERALENDPSLAQAHWMLSRLRKNSAGNSNIEKMIRLMERAKGLDSVLFGYALYKEYDDLDDIENAWRHLEQAMALRRQGIVHDESEERRIFQVLSEGDWKETEASPPPGPAPIFIVGLPRSGTTLLETMLGRHRDVEAAGELHDAVIQLRWTCDHFGGFQLDRTLVEKSVDADLGIYGARYLEKTKWLSRGKRFFTDKMPSNFMLIGPLACAIPNAIFLHVTRDPIDVCFSNLRELFAGPYTYSYDQSEMAAHYLGYRGLMKRWKRDFAERILDVSYEDLVNNPRDVMSKIVRFCGLDWDEMMLSDRSVKAVAATASALQIREPVHQRFVGRSQKYQKFLGPLIAAIKHNEQEGEFSSH